MDDPSDLDPPHPRAMLESDEDDDQAASAQITTPPSFSASRSSRRRSNLGRPSKPRNIRTPSSPMASTIPHNNLPSAPASPPTPAPSPSLGHRLPDWSTADESEEAASRELRHIFTEASEAQKKRLLTEILNLCNNRQLTYVHDIVCPRLKKDPFTTLPNEICLRVSSHCDKRKMETCSPADVRLLHRSCHMLIRRALLVVRRKCQEDGMNWCQTTLPGRS